LEITPEQVLARYADPGIPVRVRTATDVDPLGYAAAMAPAFVHREHGDLQADSIVLRNVNHGGNPVEGSTGLCSVQISTSGLAGVEFVLVPLDKTIPGGTFHHAQLRFIFADDNSPRLLGVAADDKGSDNRVGDLVFSWEAWRAPGAGYSVLSGLDPGSYDLCLRVYSGPQRFLEDALGHKDWYCHPMRLPGGHAGVAELFRVALALGDGLARATATRRLEEMGEDSPTWESFRRLAAPVVEEDAIDLPPEELQTYQTLLRSCATMALYSITLALDRLQQSGYVDGVDWDKVPKSPIDREESWMKEVATANLGGLAKAAPRALKFLRANPASFPGRIPDLLNDAGLLERNGETDAARHHYSLKDATPYGKLSDKLIR
jgi:hypothetical protein